MQIEVKVTLSATPELLTALQALAGLKAPEPVKATKVLKAVSPVVTESAPASLSGTASSTSPSSNGATHTLESLRAIAVPKSKAGKKDEIKAWLSEAGYASLQDLQEKDFNAFHAFIEKL